MSQINKIFLLPISIVILLSSYIILNNDWTKLRFYMKNPQQVTFSNMKFKYNYGMSYEKIDDGLVLSYIGEIGRGDLVLIANATYRSDKDIISYYKSSNNNELISYENIKFKNIDAVSVKYYALPSKKYMHSIFVIPKNVIIGYSGLRENESRFQYVMDSFEFNN